MESDSTVFIVLSILAAFGRFAAYALDPKLGLVQPTLPVTLVGVAPPPRATFTVAALAMLRHFTIHTFGNRYFSLGKFLRVAAISAFIVLGVFIFSHAISESAWRAPADESLGHTAPVSLRIAAIAGCLFALIVFNAVADTIVIAAIRHLIEPFHGPYLDHSRWLQLTIRAAALPLYAAFVYLCFIATMNAAFSAIITIRGSVAGYPLLDDLSLFTHVQLQIWHNETIPRLIDPIGEGERIAVGTTNLLYFCVTPAIPVLILLVTVITGLLMDLINLTTNGQVMAALSNSPTRRTNQAFAIAMIVSIVGGTAAVLLGK